MHPRAHHQRTLCVSSIHTVHTCNLYNSLAFVPALPFSRLPHHVPLTTSTFSCLYPSMAWRAPDRLLGLPPWSTLCAHSRACLLHCGNPPVVTCDFDCPFRGMQGGGMFLSSSTASISGASFTSCSAVSVDCFRLFTTPTKPGLVDQCHPRHFPVAVSQSHGTYDTLTSNRTRTWALAPHPHSHPTQ